MHDVILVGGGGHGSVLASVLRRDGLGRLIGLIDVEARSAIPDLPWLGRDEDLTRGRWEASLLFGIGLIRNSSSRWKLYQQHRAAGYRFLTLVSSHASVAREAHVGEGAVVLDQALVGPDAQIGEAAIINNGAIIEHGCRVGSNSHIATNATVCGDVKVGSGCLLGAGSVVIPGISITDECIVGAGSVVVADLETPGVYVGTPAVMHRKGAV